MFKVSKGYNTITTTIRIPENIYQQLSDLAVENKLSLNKLILIFHLNIDKLTKV